MISSVMQICTNEFVPSDHFTFMDTIFGISFSIVFMYVQITTPTKEEV